MNVGKNRRAWMMRNFDSCVQSAVLLVLTDSWRTLTRWPTEAAADDFCTQTQRTKNSVKNKELDQEQRTRSRTKDYIKNKELDQEQETLNSKTKS